VITITFTQCAEKVTPDPFSAEMMMWAVIPRIRMYEETLLSVEFEGGGQFTTLDELFLLVAQKLKREGKLKEVRFESLCTCKGETEFAFFDLDKEGDFPMGEYIHHGFFPQRLSLLR
jgi:hypothetical protein